MTESKHLKARIRARMARTGERYMTARRHVVGERPSAPVDDHGWRLRGGVHPDSAGDRERARPPRRPRSPRRWCSAPAAASAPATSCGSSRRTARAALVLGFRNQWQYPGRWAAKTLERLGVPFELHETGGAKGAAAKLDAALARRAPGARHRRPAGDRPLAPARAQLGPRRLPGRRPRRRRRRDARSTTATSRRSPSTRDAPRRRTRPRWLLQAPAGRDRAGRDHRPTRCAPRPAPGSPTPRRT